MQMNEFTTLEGEKIILENELVVLTDRRLIDMSTGKARRKTLKEANLKEITTFQKIKGGRESRMHLGLRSGVVGLGMLLLSYFLGLDILSFLPSFLEMVAFLSGAVTILVGVHFIVNSWARIKPHTTIIFLIPSSGELVVSFPGHDNNEAEALIRSYTRARRGL